MKDFLHLHQYFPFYFSFCIINRNDEVLSLKTPPLEMMQPQDSVFYQLSPTIKTMIINRKSWSLFKCVEWALQSAVAYSFLHEF